MNCKYFKVCLCGCMNHILLVSEKKTNHSHPPLSLSRKLKHPCYKTRYLTSESDTEYLLETKRILLRLPPLTALIQQLLLQD